MRGACLALFVFAAQAALACSCISYPPKTSFKNADAVFFGEVIETTDRRLWFRPIEVFKGEVSEETEFHVGDGCGYGQRAPGSRHVIYAYRTELGEYGISMCSRSLPETHELAPCDLRYLRSRAWWWRSPLSSLRILERLGIYWQPCRRASVPLAPAARPAPP